MLLNTTSTRLCRRLRQMSSLLALWLVCVQRLDNLPCPRPDGRPVAEVARFGADELNGGLFEEVQRGGVKLAVKQGSTARLDAHGGRLKRFREFPALQ